MKVFEDYFTEIQADMIQICLEYIEGVAEKIYIYASFEENVISCDFFYKLNGKIVERHKLNEASDKQFDISIERQKACLKILNEDMKKLSSVCEEYSKPMPTEIKLIYNVMNNSVNSHYEYEVIYSNDDEKMPDDIAEEWFANVKKEEENDVEKNWH